MRCIVCRRKCRSSVVDHDQYRIFVWTAFLCCIVAAANMKSKDMDYKQLMSSFSISTMGLAMVRLSCTRCADRERLTLDLNQSSFCEDLKINACKGTVELYYLMAYCWSKQWTTIEEGVSFYCDQMDHSTDADRFPGIESSTSLSLVVEVRQAVPQLLVMKVIEVWGTLE